MKRISIFLFAIFIFASCTERVDEEQKPVKEIPDQYSGQINNDAEFKAIVGGTIVKVEEEGYIENSTILIKDGKIHTIGKAGEIHLPANTEIIDAKEKFIIPGMTDGHIHFFQSGGLYTRPDGLDLRHRMPYEQELSWIRENIDDVFNRYLRSGITTVIDMGGPYWNFDIRRKAADMQKAPRTYVAGPLIASYSPPQLQTDDPAIIKVNSKEEALELVRKQAEMGTDFIKIWYVVSRGGSPVMEREKFYPVVKAVVDESHKRGLPVWIHATELETARSAVEAGCDVLVHNVTDKEIDDDLIEMMKANDVILIPTLWVFSSYAAVYSKQLDLMPVEHLWGNPYVIGTLYDMHELSDDELGERQKKLQAENPHIKTSDVLLKNLKKMQDAGITIAVGTDAGNVGVIHGPAIFHDFEIMREAGLSNHEILVDATLNGAKLLDKEDEFGSIAEGKAADLVILNSNPIEDIQNTQDIYLVARAGNVYKPDDLVKPDPEDIAQIQLNAYNERDLETFLSVYAPDVEVYNFPDELQYKGIDKMRERYSEFFDKADELHCKLLNRIVQGKYVMDKELVTTGIPGRDTIRASALYEIENGFIQKVWFLREK